jgi:hypothetical protein
LCCADYYTLLRFLRARNYIYDKAVKMWLDTLEWRKEYDVDTILDNFVFHEREQFLMAYPQGYHKTDKLVCTAAAAAPCSRTAASSACRKTALQQQLRCGQAAASTWQHALSCLLVSMEAQQQLAAL